MAAVGDDVVRTVISLSPALLLLLVLMAPLTLNTAGGARDRLPHARRPARRHVSAFVICGCSLFVRTDAQRNRRVSAYWRSVGQRDATWRAFIAVRWRVERPERLQRACGTESLCELYRYLDRNRYLPRGKYTSKQQLVWGKSRQEGADVWLTVAHRPDCRVPSLGGAPVIQLRVAIQNLREQPLSVDLADIRVRMKNGYMNRVLSAGALAPKLLALNGSSSELATADAALHAVCLQMFDFAVVSVNVECPGCEFEAEFLEG